MNIEGYKYYFRAEELANTVSSFIEKWARKVVLQNPIFSEEKKAKVSEKLQKLYRTNEFKCELRDAICETIGTGDGGWTSQYFDFKQFCVGIYNSASVNGSLIANALSKIGLTLEDVGLNSPVFSGFALRASMPECAYGTKLEMWQWFCPETNGQNVKIATLCLDEIPTSKFVSSIHVAKGATLFEGDNKLKFEQRDNGVGAFVDKIYRTLLVNNNPKLKELLSKCAWFEKRIEELEYEIGDLKYHYVGNEYQQKVLDRNEQIKQVREYLKDAEEQLKIEKEKAQTDFYKLVLNSQEAASANDEQSTTSKRKRK